MVNGPYYKSRCTRLPFAYCHGALPGHVESPYQNIYPKSRSKHGKYGSLERTLIWGKGVLNHTYFTENEKTENYFQHNTTLTLIPIQRGRNSELGANELARLQYTNWNMSIYMQYLVISNKISKFLLTWNYMKCCKPFVELYEML